MPRIRSTIKSLARTAAGVLAAALLHGCATTYEMEVDAIRNPEPVAEGAESYAIVPRDPNTNTNDLRYKETVGWIKTALSAKGYYEALDPQAADMVIQVDYGMEPPRREIKIVQEPVYAQIRQPDQVRAVTIVDPVTKKPRTSYVTVRGGYTTELAGYRDRAVSVLVNEKYLVLTAKENKMGEASADTPPEELWSVTVRNDDESDDLREYLPIMAAAATDSINSDTGNGTKVRLKSDDEVVSFIKQGLAKEPLASAQ